MSGGGGGGGGMGVWAGQLEHKNNTYSLNNKAYNSAQLLKIKISFDHGASESFV